MPMSGPASSVVVPAAMVVDGCTIVTHPGAAQFTSCPGADLAGTDLSGTNLAFADLSSANLAGTAT